MSDDERPSMPSMSDGERPEKPDNNGSRPETPGKTSGIS